MTLFVAWVVYPLLISGLSLGCGLLLEWAAGRRLPGPLVLPAGFGMLVVVASFTTMRPSTAQFTSPLVVGLALAGFGLSFSLHRRVNPWAVGAAVAVFAVYAAPIVFSGAATFAGYITLDDTSTWLAFADNALKHGRSVTDLAPSTYSTVLHDNLSLGYPLGSFLPLGIGQQLTGTDAAWLFQPQLAFLAALLALSIYALTAGLIRSRALRAVVAILGAQPALLFAYAYWSGIKEITVAALLGFVAAFGAFSIREIAHPREILPLAVGCAAVLASLSAAAAVWFAPFIVFVVLLVAARGPRAAARVLGMLVALGLLSSIPALATARPFIHEAQGEITTGSTLGNLGHPLSHLQIFGIWPVGDFRFRPSDIDVTYVLIAALAVAGVIGIFEAVRRRAWGVPLYAAIAVGGCILIIALDKLGHGSPWLDAKALATASPAPVVAGVAGAAAMFESGRRVEAAVAGAAIAAGVLWSNALTYGDVWLAPYDQLSELESIGHRFAGDGPALMTEYQPYGVRHFLRDLDPEGASERRARPVYLRGGGILQKLQYADIDAFALRSVLVYRTLVLRTSPVASRPPSVYRLASSGRFYEVWQRPQGPQRILEHLSLGTAEQPASVASCADVRRLAALAAQSNGTLVAAERTPAQAVGRVGGGAETATFTVRRGGVYGFWLGGLFRDRFTLSVDGKRVGSDADELNWTGQLTPLGQARLAAGNHDLELRRSRRALRPGGRGPQFLPERLESGQPAAAARLVTVAPAQAASLCGRRLDWIEAVGA
jgi:hypothetical protein